MLYSILIKTEKILIIFEMALHPLFNVAQANCRLDYRQRENRAFFITIFKHIYFMGQKGCSRTALEFCKILLRFAAFLNNFF